MFGLKDCLDLKSRDLTEIPQTWDLDGAKSITEAEEKYNCLLSTLDPQLSLKYQKRCEEATKEGGKLLGPPLGTWSIPPIIEDEELYRYEVSKNARPPAK
ncbi:hypothetical protein OSB04_000682 [Centaurea solstitialis]|uniref:Uncharacterized protein n=1 Tax=Centaurea solstitialis TaxID=347529 RepID=A0AA38U049_9ASTR|nr:hypothetical protein OSB04_000682 [Centaurea solstitialis]